MKKTHSFVLLSLLFGTVFMVCDNGYAAILNQDTAMELKSKTLSNQAAYIPPQCYTKTKDEDGTLHNPCYSCHINSSEPNYTDDADLQTSYAFPNYAKINNWTNLFKDRSEKVQKITDKEALEYVRTDNYKDVNSKIFLLQRLKAVPSEWDYDDDKKWGGYVPDCYFSFDDDGFDKDPSGEYTGWRAFAYYPFLGTFWPTNGSTDDVLIRLPNSFRVNENGRFDKDTYIVNLAIVESLIKRSDVQIPSVDESKYGADLDKNGKIGVASLIKYDWAPNQNRFMSYVGEAKKLYSEGKLSLAGGLFPKGTEFLHSVRYIDVSDDGKTRMAPRMKELRYAVKTKWLRYSDLMLLAQGEAKEKASLPDRLKSVLGDIEYGVSLGNGWRYQGFIEDKTGSLRPQTYEESLFCVGCHSNIGATTDSTFSFARKLGSDAFAKGWYHWSKKDFSKLSEPKSANGEYEYTTYLKNNGAADEFRSNDEATKKFFDKNGSLKPSAAELLHTDISTLLMPSVQRATALNKAYMVTVGEQSYIYGRDAIVVPVKNIHDEITQDETGIVQKILRFFRGN